MNFKRYIHNFIIINFLNYLITVINCTFPFHSTNVFGCFCIITAQFKLVKQKFFSK